MKNLLILIMLSVSTIAFAEHPSDIVPESLLYDFTPHTVVATNNVTKSITVGKHNYLDDDRNPHKDIGIPDALYWDD